ncbi:phosphoribosyltransferase family protein [Mucilaginibacter sp.]|uniref:ComF family protein n=1 Tax=Mucilaginibacter sp. TaxID=1882438 RepID=UPI002844CE59|nr:phosphoribosyltransferase family protein [Mucilaginibacter sp.]MDR3694502.1 phosphoribosyltransferase family protein [Mucilaginibacter sp.]
MNVKGGYLADFVSLLFPELCAACGESLVANEHLICTSCRITLPYTNFHLQPDNIVAQQFWGKIILEGGFALFYFAKGGKVQNLMHRFKYKGQKEIGNLLGEIAGAQLIKNEVFKTVDIIVPVPLHKKRLRQRGYNQSACFAEGLAGQLNAAVAEYNLVRPTATETQTHKSRFDRYENMQEVFSVLNPEELKNKHVLLVDDVITTGSTLEACGAQLLKVEGLKLSIATIAYAE